MSSYKQTLLVDVEVICCCLWSKSLSYQRKLTSAETGPLLLGKEPELAEADPPWGKSSLCYNSMFAWKWEELRSGTHSCHSRVAKTKVNSLKTGGRQGNAMGLLACLYHCLDPSGDAFVGNHNFTWHAQKAVLDHIGSIYTPWEMTVS